MSDEPTVFLVDDDSNVRDAVGLFLESSGLNVRLFASAHEFLDNYRQEFAGCMILDISMPEMSGLELQEELIEKCIDIPIIFLTGHGDVPQTARAFKAGAVDFIEKPFNDEQLLDRINEAFQIDHQNRQQKARNCGILARYACLTPREQQVMKYVVIGKSNKEIARELTISHRTIDIHRARIMEKMNAKSLAELVIMSTSCGLPK